MTELSQIIADIFSTTEDYDHKISVTVTASKPRNSAGIVHIGRIKYGLSPTEIFWVAHKYGVSVQALRNKMAIDSYGHKSHYPPVCKNILQFLVALEKEKAEPVRETEYSNIPSIDRL
jgi:hypothetical protein